MVKVLSVYCVICMQPQQTPFGLSDLWKWLAKLTNECVNRKVDCFFIPTIFEVALRISSPMMLKAFGTEFMQMLTIIQTKVLPNFEATTIKFEALNEFLQRYISTNGNDYMGFFTTK